MDKIKVVIDALAKVNAIDINIYDVNERNPFFASVVVASVESLRQLNACLDHLKDEFALNKLQVKSTSGQNTEWIILDGNDILVHVFSKEERERISIDKLYMDSPLVDLSKYSA